MLKSEARCHTEERLLFLNSNKEKLLSKQSDGFHFSVICTHVRRLKGHYFWLNTQNCHLQFVYSLQYITKPFSYDLPIQFCNKLEAMKCDSFGGICGTACLRWVISHQKFTWNFKFRVFLYITSSFFK